MSSHDANGEDTFVRITNRELYVEVRDLKAEVQAMRLDMSSILKDNVEKGRRIRALEMKVYTILAGLTTTLVAAGMYLLKAA